MSEPEVDLDYRLWELYLNDCQQKHLTPSPQDYMVWLQEEGYDEDD